MRNCGAIILAEIDRQNVKRKDVCEFVGIQASNINKVLGKQSIDAGQLEKFCQYLNLDPMDFFDYRPEYIKHRVNDIEQHHVIGTANVAVNGSSESIFERLLTEKDKRIEALEKIIEMQKAQLEKLEGGQSTDASRT